MDDPWLQILVQFGFPIAALIVVVRWTAGRVESAEKRCVDREVIMQQQIEGLQTEIRDELKGLVRESTKAVNASNERTSNNTEALREATAVMANLKRSTVMNVPPGADVHVTQSGSEIIKGRGEESIHE